MKSNFRDQKKLVREKQLLLDRIERKKKKNQARKLLRQACRKKEKELKHTNSQILELGLVKGVLAKIKEAAELQPVLRDMKVGDTSMSSLLNLSQAPRNKIPTKICTSCIFKFFRLTPAKPINSEKHYVPKGSFCLKNIVHSFTVVGIGLALEAMGFDRVLIPLDSFFFHLVTGSLYPSHEVWEAGIGSCNRLLENLKIIRLARLLTPKEMTQGLEKAIDAFINILPDKVKKDQPGRKGQIGKIGSVCPFIVASLYSGIGEVGSPAQGKAPSMVKPTLVDSERAVSKPDKLQVGSSIGTIPNSVYPSGAVVFEGFNQVRRGPSLPVKPSTEPQGQIQQVKPYVTGVVKPGLSSPKMEIPDSYMNPKTVTCFFCGVKRPVSERLCMCRKPKSPNS